jgi:hypothetical protein
MTKIFSFLFFVSSNLICGNNKSKHQIPHLIVLFVVGVFMEIIPVFEHVYHVNLFLNVMLFYHLMLVKHRNKKEILSLTIISLFILDIKM